MTEYWVIRIKKPHKLVKRVLKAISPFIVYLFYFFIGFSYRIDYESALEGYISGTAYATIATIFMILVMKWVWWDKK